MNMKLASILIAILIVASCTTLQPVEMSPEQLHARISAGDVLNEGDKVKIVTTDGKIHQFRVTDVNDTSIVGDDVEVPIVHIVALETREFSGGKTAALVGGSYVALAMLVALAVSGIAVGL